MRRFSLALGIGCLLLVMAIYVVGFLPLPVKRTVYQEDSPDGTMTGVYSYRPAGLLGLALGDSSYIYLDVYRKASKQRLVHSKGFGDVPWEAIDRLHHDLPWPARRTKGSPPDS
jgi:hypothetical protein